MKEYLPLILVVLLAVVLRFWHLGQNPPALTWDEVAWGYNAYSLGLTGKDEFGRFLPLNYLESFGDFKPPIYAYLTVLPIKCFGLNEFAVRFPSAFLGTLTVLLTYFLVKELFPKCLTPPLVTTLLLAISPWHIMLSRAAFEANVATFFLVAGVTFFLIGIRQKNWFLFLSTLSFAFSLETFNTARIVAPLLVLGLAIGFRKELWSMKRWVMGTLLLGLIILLPSLSFFFSPQARLRFREVNIFSDPEVVITANQEMVNDRKWLATLFAEDKFTWWSRIIHNRRWGYARLYLRHYFDHFRPDFLFIKGDGNPKFSTQDVGELYLWELPFLVVGILFLFRKRPAFWWLIPYWLLIGVVPAATARETPHALRIETTLPTWQILTAFGVVEFWRFAKKQKPLAKNLLLITNYLLLITNFVYFQHGYWRHYPAEFSGEWQYGYKPAIEFVKTVEDQYDEIWFTDELGRPYIYFLFYLQEEPQRFWQEARVKRETFGFVKVEGFGKYHFSKAMDFSRQGKVLYIEKADKTPKDAKVLETFYLLNGNEILKAFET